MCKSEEENKKLTKKTRKKPNKQTHGDSNLYRLKTSYHRPDALAIEWRRYEDIGYSKIHVHPFKEESESETEKQILGTRTLPSDKHITKWTYKKTIFSQETSSRKCEWKSW